MSETSPILQLTGISKRFGAVQALLDVDLGLLAGEVHALVGENGAGKSTLVKILAGIHRPDAGEMTLNGRVSRPYGRRERFRWPASPQSGTRCRLERAEPYG